MIPIHERFILWTLQKHTAFSAALKWIIRRLPMMRPTVFFNRTLWMPKRYQLRRLECRTASASLLFWQNMRRIAPMRKLLCGNTSKRVLVAIWILMIKPESFWLTPTLNFACCSMASNSVSICLHWRMKFRWPLVPRGFLMFCKIVWYSHFECRKFNSNKEKHHGTFMLSNIDTSKMDEEFYGRIRKFEVLYPNVPLNK